MTGTRRAAPAFAPIGAGPTGLAAAKVPVEQGVP